MINPVLHTLAYADIFDYPLKKSEVWRWLISPTSLSLPKIQVILKDLTADKTLETSGGYYFFPGREKIVKTREKREKQAQKKLEIAQNTADKLKRLPWIKMVGITGALAMDNADEDDDIDLMIITSPNRLWLTRLLIILLSPILGIQRRKPKDQEVKNKICFNLFLDENHLKISPENLFSAHEVCQVKPILNKDQTYERFLFENRWVKKFLPNAIKINNSKSQVIYHSRFFDLTEKLVFRIQYLYMKPKITQERISFHQAFFHPRDLSGEIEKKLKEKLKYN